MSVLIVDDETDIALLFRQQFRRELREGKLSCHFAHSGEEALAIVEGEKAAELVLILSDINMPGMSGVELLRRIKRKSAQLKVFMITAYGDDKSFEDARAAGADDFITKPIDFALLRQKMFQALGIS